MGTSPTAGMIFSAHGVNSGRCAKRENYSGLRGTVFDSEETTQYNHTIPTMRSYNLTIELGTNENIVDRDVNQLHEIADQTHGNKTNRSGSGGLSELYVSISPRTQNPSYQASCND